MARMRKNASLDSVAKAAFNMATIASKEHRRLQQGVEQRSRVGHVTMEERWRVETAFKHFWDLKELSEHLLRLIGLTEDEIEHKQAVAWYGRKMEVANGN